MAGRRIPIEQVANFRPVNIRALWPSDVELAAELDVFSGMDGDWDAFKIRRCVYRKCYLKFAAYAESSQAHLDGYLILRLSVPEVEIVRVAVARDHWRLRVGSQLLRTALEELSRGVFQKARVVARVHEQNEAGLAFFWKHGFAVTGVERGMFEDYHYERLRRDAFVLERRPVARGRSR